VLLCTKPGQKNLSGGISIVAGGGWNNMATKARLNIVNKIVRNRISTPLIWWMIIQI